MEHDVIKLHKEIECAKDKLNKSIENGEDYNTIYKNSIAVDKLIAKYLKAEKYLKDERSTIMKNFDNILNAPFKDEILSQIKADVKERYKNVLQEELDYFSYNVYVYAVLMAHNVTKNDILIQLNYLNNKFFDEMQEDGKIKNCCIHEDNTDFYKQIDEKYLKIVKERI